MPPGDVVVQWAGNFALVVLLLGMLLAFVRLARGPDAADRIVALDLISVLVVAFLAAYSICGAETSYLDVAIAFALIAFLGTVAFARFLDRSRETRPARRAQGEEDDG